MGDFLITLGLLSLFFAFSLRHVPASPPHFAVVTMFGKRLPAVRDEGYRIFPFYPVVFGAILVEATKRNQELIVESIPTSDLAQLSFSVSVTWTPDRNHAIQYLDSGGEAGVRGILEDVIRERIRQYTVSSDWMDTIAIKDEVTAYLAREVAGLDADMDSDEERSLIQKLRRGATSQPVRQLGIIINRLNITNVEILGDLQRAAERYVVEERERAAEELEIAHVIEMINEIQETLDISYDKAQQLLQVERGKIEEKIHVLKPGVSEEAVQDVLKLLG